MKRRLYSEKQSKRNTIRTPSLVFDRWDGTTIRALDRASIRYTCIDAYAFGRLRFLNSIPITGKENKRQNITDREESGPVSRTERAASDQARESELSGYPSPPLPYSFCHPPPSPTTAKGAKRSRPTASRGVFFFSKKAQPA